LTSKVPYKACSGFTFVTAHRIAQRPKAAFVAGLRPSQLPGRAACQLPDQSTIIRVRPSLTDSSRPRGARSIASFWPSADLFRSAPNSGHSQRRSACLKGAMSGLMHRYKSHVYSITSSARPSNVSGTVRPSEFAVFALMTRSIFVLRCTGKFSGFSPFSTRPTKSPT
jgi:hypothetical protein